MAEINGQCLCGAVRFALAPPTLFFAHCHCQWCREAHGAAFVSWVGAALERFRLLPGSAEPRWYQSSAQSRRGFCADCGTTLFFASALFFSAISERFEYRRARIALLAFACAGLIAGVAVALTQPITTG